MPTPEEEEGPLPMGGASEERLAKDRRLFYIWYSISVAVLALVVGYWLFGGFQPH